MSAGFVYSQILSSCVRSGVLQALRGGGRDVAALAAQAGLPTASMQSLLGAAAALGLVERVGDDVFLGEHGAAFLGQSGLAEMIAHHDKFYADLQDPIALFRRGRGAHLGAYWPYAGSPRAANADNVAAYSALMGATQPSIAADVLDAYPMRCHAVVMDVGGGQGGFLDAVGARWPHLSLHLFDLPAVVQRARAVMRSPATFHEGDFTADALPRGADLVTLIRVLHDHDDATAERLLTSIRSALGRRARLLIAEPMLSARGEGRFAGAYLAMYLLAMGRGRPRSPAEIIAMARAVGFRRIRMLRVRTPELLRGIVAET